MCYTKHNTKVVYIKTTHKNKQHTIAQHKSCVKGYTI